MAHTIYHDLKKEALRGCTIGDVTAREGELRRMARTLQRRFGGNVLVRGASGTGKTALVEGFAYRAARGKIEGFEGCDIVGLDAGSQEIAHVPRGTVVIIDNFFDVAQAPEQLLRGGRLVITMDEQVHQRSARSRQRSSRTLRRLRWAKMIQQKLWKFCAALHRRLRHLTELKFLLRPWSAAQSCLAE